MTTTDPIAPITPTRTTVNVGTVAVTHSRAHHTLTITGYRWDGTRAEAVELRIPASEVPHLLRGVAVEAGQLLTEVADDLFRGHCNTCYNTRRVSVLQQDGTAHVDVCGACAPAGEPGTSPFARAPKAADFDPRA